MLEEKKANTSDQWRTFVDRCQVEQEKHMISLALFQIKSKLLLYIYIYIFGSDK